MLLSIGIQEAVDGGYVISLGSDDGKTAQVAAARTNLPEVMQWVADKAAKTFSASPYMPQPQLYPQQPQYPPREARPPDIPEVERFPNIVRGDEPEDPSLVGRISAGRRINGVAAIAFMLCVGASKVLGA